MSWLWSYVASVTASVTFGMMCLAILFYQKKHRNADGFLVPTRISLAFIQGAALYTLVICLIGHFLMHIPLHLTILNNFGNERVGWVLIAISCDLAARMYQMFDPG